MRYKLEALKGTERFVLNEMKEKFPDISCTRKLKFNSELVIDNFNILLSPIRIIQEGKIVRNLAKRSWRKSYVDAGINPSLAYILCSIANMHKDSIIYDPFCGSSVIPITALLYFQVKKVIASDISGKAIYSSSLNFKTAAISPENFRLFQSDVKDVRLNKRNVDSIITNLPFGIRAGMHSTNIKIYLDFEYLCSKLLRKKGKIIVLTQEKNLLRETFKKWNIKNIARVDEGGLLPEIFEITFKQ